MKKRFVMGLTALMLTVSIAGCGDPSKLTSKNVNEPVVEEEITGETSEEAVSDGVSQGQATGSEQNAEGDGAEASTAEAAEKPMAVTSDGVAFDPEEIVEPALPAAEVQQAEAVTADVPATDTTETEQTVAETSAETPVEDPAATPAEEPKKDKYYDIVFIGDSQFDNARGTASDIPSYTCSLLGKKVKFYNLAIGGTAASLSRDMGLELDTFSDSCFIGISYALAGKINASFLDQYPAGEELKRVDPEKVDLYVIEYGANDYINGKDLYNSNYVDYHSYSGALSEGINTLKTISPKAQFILCGPSYCVWYNSDGYLIGDSYTVSKGIGTLSEYSNTASNLASDMGIDFMDSMYASQFDLKMETIDDYLVDGLHYNEKGRQIYAAVLAHRIQKLRGLDDSEMPYIEINNFDFWAYSDSIKKK